MKTDSPDSTLKVERSPEGVAFSWVRLNCKAKRWRGGENQFPTLVSFLIPENRIVYAGLGSGYDEVPDMIEHLEGLSFQYEIPQRLDQTKKSNPSTRKSWWHRVLKSNRGSSHFGAIYTQADKNFAVHAFEHYGYWLIDNWIFLVSTHPLERWPQLLDRACHGVVEIELLTKIEFLMTNRWEHGFDVLSCNLNYDQLVGIAGRAADGVNWGVELKS